MAFATSFGKTKAPSSRPKLPNFWMKKSSFTKAATPLSNNSL